MTEQLSEYAQIIKKELARTTPNRIVIGGAVEGIEKTLPYLKRPQAPARRVMKVELGMIDGFRFGCGFYMGVCVGVAIIICIGAVTFGLMGMFGVAIFSELMGAL